RSRSPRLNVATGSTAAGAGERGAADAAIGSGKARGKSGAAGMAWPCMSWGAVAWTLLTTGPSAACVGPRNTASTRQAAAGPPPRIILIIAASSPDALEPVAAGLGKYRQFGRSFIRRVFRNPAFPHCPDIAKAHDLHTPQGCC